MSSIKVIKDTVTLKDFLNKVISEAVEGTKKRLAEQDDETEVLQSGDITVDEVIEKLNTIRAGKSFKDAEIKASMEAYIDNLDDAEKTALFAFLKGIAQIVGGEVEGSKALEPSDKPANVKMEKKPTVQKVKVKPVVIKKPQSEESAEKPLGGSEAKEDTTPPLPITPKK